MKTVTNYQPRPVLYWHDLKTNEQEDLRGHYKGIEESSFVRYRGTLYDLGEAMVYTHRGALKDDWDGYWGDTYFSAAVVRLCGDDSVVMGMVFS